MTPANLDDLVHDGLQRVAGTSQPIDVDRVIGAVYRRMARRRRRRLVTGAAVVGVVIMCGALLVGRFVQDDEQRVQVNSGTSGSDGQIDALVLWIGWREGPTLADPNTGTTTAIGPTDKAETGARRARLCGSAIGSSPLSIAACTCTSPERRPCKTSGQETRCSRLRTARASSSKSTLNSCSGPWTAPARVGRGRSPRDTTSRLLRARPQQACWSKPPPTPSSGSSRNGSQRPARSGPSARTTISSTRTPLPADPRQSSLAPTVITTSRAGCSSPTPRPAT